MWSPAAILLFIITQARTPSPHAGPRTPVDRRLALVSLLGGIAVYLLLWALTA